MAQIRTLDKRSGITYVYESKSWWDPERKMSRAKRKLIGKVDPETGEVVPTDGRMKKAAERRAAEAEAAKAASTAASDAANAFEARIAALEAEVARLTAAVEALERRQKAPAGKGDEVAEDVEDKTCATQPESKHEQVAKDVPSCSLEGTSDLTVQE